jgi:hypothetical protein
MKHLITLKVNGEKYTVAAEYRKLMVAVLTGRAIDESRSRAAR